MVTYYTERKGVLLSISDQLMNYSPKLFYLSKLLVSFFWRIKGMDVVTGRVQTYTTEY